MTKDGARTGSATLLKDAALPAAHQQVCDWLLGGGLDPHEDTATGAGGAWVDALRGRAARDYDINLYIAPERRDQVLAALAASADTHMEFNSRAMVFNLPGNVIVDVKLVDKPQTPQRALRDIDVGVSAVAADMFAGKVWAAPEYTQDMEAKALRLRPGHKPTKINTDYLAKLTKKYPDFTLVK